MGTKVLVVDDELKIVRVLRGYLEQSGYDVISSQDGQTALHQFRREKPALVLLDLHLPKIDGLDVCRTIRKESDVPIIMVTARVEETDKLIGLELGADDYVTKPFSPREVVARVRAVLRRATGGMETQSEIFSVGDLTIDIAKRAVTLKEKVIELTPTEFDLLTTLARTPDRVYTRLQLLDAVQGYAFDGYERTIDTHIKNIRQKIEPDPKNPQYILTVFGVGYKLAEQ